MYIIATTSRSGIKECAYIDEFLRDSGFPLAVRGKQSLDDLIRAHHADAAVVCYRQGPILYYNQEKFFFHPSMAKNRLAAYRKSGTADPFASACRFKPDDEVLDCTLGLGADAIVAAYFTPAGRVVGLESSPAIAPVVKWGMKQYDSAMSWLNQAIERIEVVNSEHYEYLRGLDSGSFDIVYFDPMFRKPLLKSQAISPLRAWADHRPLDRAAVKEACRVARKRVVIKELAAGDELRRLGCETIIGGKNRKIVFGIIALS